MTRIPPPPPHPSSYRRRLVVLGGWLGCQPRHLKSYEKLYKRLGFDTVFSYIPTPLQVVQCTIPKSKWQGTRRRTSPPSTNVPPSSTMKELAGQVLQDVRNELFDDDKSKKNHNHKINKNPIFIYHGFSNGGCFLWKELRTLLEEEEKETSQYSLKQYLGGVVFDSCPAWFDNIQGTYAALQYCAPEEQEIVMASPLGPALQAASKSNNQTQDQETLQLCQDLFDSIGRDSLNVPQLYLYSHNDPLSSAKHIQQLIRDRWQWLQERHGSSSKIVLLQRLWADSKHCAHLKCHPNDYFRAVQYFVETTTTTPTTTRTKLVSRL